MDLLTGLGLDDIFTENENGVLAELPDGLPGSTLGLVSSGHSISTSYSYQPFGQKTTSGTRTNNPTTFQRGVLGGGLYYFRARYYNPALQRWMSRDPLGLGRGAPSTYAFLHPWVPSGRVGPPPVAKPILLAPRMQFAPPGGRNLYAYANNDPINFNDRMGLIPGGVGGGGGWGGCEGQGTGCFGHANDNGSLAGAAAATLAAAAAALQADPTGVTGGDTGGDSSGGDSTGSSSDPGADLAVAVAEALYTAVAIGDFGIIGFEVGFAVGGPMGAGLGTLVGMAVGAGEAVFTIGEETGSF